jgi:hypothetical protein
MKIFIPALLLLLLAAGGCKKDRAAGTLPAKDTITVTAGAPLVANITGISPAVVTAGTVVTLTGTNLGTAASDWVIYLQNKQATVQSVTPTEIKVIAPQTSTGMVTAQKRSSPVSTSSALLFTYYEASVINAYTNGDVQLVTQAEVDAFARLNKGKQLNIKGNLTIGLPTNSAVSRSDIASVTALTDVIASVSGTITLRWLAIAEAPFLNTITTAGGISINQCDFTSLKFNALQSLAGNISLTSLSKLNQLSFNQLYSVNNLNITSCASLADLSGFSHVQNAASINFSILNAVTAINMDELKTVSASGITLLLNTKLNHLSFKSLNNVTGALQLMSCLQLSDIDFKSLKSVSDRLTIVSTNLTNLDGFGAVQTLGALNLTSNPSLTSLQGMEQLTRLTLPAINGTVYSAEGLGFGLRGLAASLGGVNLQSNPALLSLAGLQNITALPVAYISGNKLLNDFCPFKKLSISTRALPDYSYTYLDRTINSGNGVTSQRTVAALTLTNNGNYATTPDALAAIALCK